MEHRFTRTELVLGQDNLQRLADTTVAVVGVGGVGGYVAEALARSGVGTLILIDHDVVQLTNLNRQIVALESTIGRPKVEVMAERISDINPECRVIIHQEYYEQASQARLLPERVDFVADAIDSVRAKVDLIEYCLKNQVPIISSLGAGNKLDPTCLEVTDISKTHTCPLARAVRGALRKRGISEGVSVVFSREAVVGRRDGSLPGSTAFVPPVAGLIMASWIVRQICREV
ncbi:MAG: tRNA threonylcarbamoyladenosine dehydratase [Firmicutes bacterium]|nr:tRNA threonylcarbamoyladenosine dehydratase [Bacillota bacterium]